MYKKTLCVEVGLTYCIEVKLIVAALLLFLTLNVVQK